LAKKENMTTAGMTNCTYQANQKWDELINIIYLKLQANLGLEAKAALISSQESWLVYKKQEHEVVAAIYKSVEGTMYIPMRAMNILLINKNRAIALNSYANAVGIKQ
jgi:uncharacterized protein YecT (DUF1311 family)